MCIHMSNYNYSCYKETLKNSNQIVIALVANADLVQKISLLK